jgi:hypothetical protein
MDVSIVSCGARLLDVASAAYGGPEQQGQRKCIVIIPRNWATCFGGRLQQTEKLDRTGATSHTVLYRNSCKVCQDSCRFAHLPPLSSKRVIHSIVDRLREKHSGVQSAKSYIAAR